MMMNGSRLVPSVLKEDARQGFLPSSGCQIEDYPVRVLPLMNVETCAPLHSARPAPDEEEMMTTATMKFGMSSEGVYCLVQGSNNLDDQEWSAYVEDMSRNADRMKGVIVFSAGSGPNANQRKLVAEMWKAHGRMPIVAVISNSALHRGMITAINWIINTRMESGLCAYPSEEAHRALAKMGVISASERQLVYQYLKTLAKGIKQESLIDRSSIVGPAESAASP
jgi:hypothetical protein